MAGMRLLQFLQTPAGEEVAEGTLGGLIAGASQLGSDQPLSQTALETAAAIAGGIGMGMLGRRIGAGLGKKIHKDPLSDQEGMMATIGRMTGQETMGEGMQQTLRQGRGMMEEQLRKKAAQEMAAEATRDPAGFFQRYQKDPQEFLREVDLYNLIGRRAAGGIDEFIEKVGDEFRKDAAEETTSPQAREMLGQLGDFWLGGKEKPLAVTGEHIGRAAGRFIGDEVGILGGLAAGSMLSQALGIESPKDRKIRELEAKLNGRAA